MTDENGARATTEESKFEATAVEPEDNNLQQVIDAFDPLLTKRAPRHKEQTPHGTPSEGESAIGGSLIDDSDSKETKDKKEEGQLNNNASNGSATTTNVLDSEETTSDSTRTGDGTEENARKATKDTDSIEPRKNRGNGDGDNDDGKEQETKSLQEKPPALRKSSIASSTGSMGGGRPKRIKDSDVQPFDFQRFLDQLRHKSADPIARYVKSFLTEFCKRPWTAKEQVKIIGDFKNFIMGKMEMYAPFCKLKDREFVNAQEGMEKLIMNRLYTRTFSPEIPIDLRSDSHEEDVIRDRVVAEKMRIWHWIEARHLDLGDLFVRNGDAFVNLASDELNKVNHYRAPRDKMICVLNCCKVIFGLLRQSRSEESADDFLPILIYVVIKAQPQHLISNVNYIQRFRNQEMLSGEAAYYLSSLVGVISFIETLDRSALSITDEEFERNVEHSVKALVTPTSVNREKTLISIDGDTTSTDNGNGNGSNNDQNATSASLLDSNSPPHTPERPTSPVSNEQRNPGQQPLNASNVLYNSAGLITAPFKSLTKFFEPEDQQGQDDQTTARSRVNLISPEESAARQVSAEELEAQRISAKEFQNVCHTLKQMFPDLDKEVIRDVLQQTESRVGAAVDVCLALVEEQ